MYCGTSYSVTAALAALLFVPATPASARWAQSPAESRIVNSGSSIYEIGSAPDGEGGIITVFHDFSPATNVDIRAQRYDRYGNPDWEPGGVRVCQATGAQTWFKVVPVDGGGCYVIWQDQRTDGGDIYGQKLNNSGQALFTTDGMPLVQMATTQNLNFAVSDEAGGFIVSYTDTHIHAQRFNPSGLPVWPGTGALASPRMGDSVTSMISDGAGGCYLGTTTFDTDYDAALVRISPSGLPDMHILTELVTGTQYGTQLARRSNGTVLAAWLDNRLGPPRIFTTEFTPGVSPAPSTFLPSRHLFAGVGAIYSSRLIASQFGDPILAFSVDAGANLYDTRIGRVAPDGSLSFSTNLDYNSGQQLVENLAESPSGLIRLTYLDFSTTDFKIRAAQFGSDGLFQWSQTVTFVDTTYPTSDRAALITGSQESLMVFTRAFGPGSEGRFPLVRLRAEDGSFGGEPVAAPANLRTTTLQASRVTLEWTDNANNETEFVVMRSTTIPSAYVAIATLPQNSQSYTDTTVAGSTNYHYAVAATNALSEETGLSEDLLVRTPPPSPELSVAPSNLFMTAKKRNATITGDIVIRNTGEIPSAPTTLQLYLSPAANNTAPGILSLINVPVPALQPGETLALQPGLKAPKKPGKKRKVLKVKLPKGVTIGGKFLVALVDSSNVNNEPNETNNLYTAGL